MQKMKTTTMAHTTMVAIAATLALWTATIACQAQSSEGKATTEGIALVIVFDTSGSMLQKVPDASGRPTPKYQIGAQALDAVLNRIQALRSSPEGAALPIQAGLVVFHGDRAQVAVKMAAFDPQPFRRWLSLSNKPSSGTPLGDAVRLAGQVVLDSKLARKHILVITDGINTKGPDPTATMPRVLQNAARQEARVSVHFVAFDVAANVFDGVKKLGATVVGAADGKELGTQLDYILEKKILLEEEELPLKK